ERILTRSVEERLAELGQRVGDRLQEQTTQATRSLSELRERLAVIDAAQKNITELSSQVVGLQDILSNKQARGAFGEVQMQDLVRSALPPSAYCFQATLASGVRADCLLLLPNPPGPIALDAKFPLESYRALREARDEAALNQARRQFATALRVHVRAIAEKYIRPGGSRAARPRKSPPGPARPPIPPSCSCRARRSMPSSMPIFRRSSKRPSGRASGSYRRRR